MKNLTSEVSRTQVPKGAVAIWWLAQAGFIFKSGFDEVFYLDPYLSNAVERAFGFKRLSLAPLEAEDVHADWVISSHEHLDHMDIDSLPVIARNNPDCLFAGSQACMPEYARMGISEKKIVLLEALKRYTLGRVMVSTVRADHGELSPDALSMLLDFGRTRILFTGDTAFNLSMMQPLIDLKPDILLTCINGRFGNLNPEEAARLTGIVSPKVVVPCHFWMFKEHNGDPESFVQACQQQCPDIPVRLLTPGEGFLYSEGMISSLPVEV